MRRGKSVVVGLGDEGASIFKADGAGVQIPRGDVRDSLVPGAPMLLKRGPPAASKEEDQPNDDPKDDKKPSSSSATEPKDDKKPSSSSATDPKDVDKKPSSSSAKDVPPVLAPPFAFAPKEAGTGAGTKTVPVVKGKKSASSPKGASKIAGMKAAGMKKSGKAAPKQSAAVLGAAPSKASGGASRRGAAAEQEQVPSTKRAVHPAAAAEVATPAPRQAASDDVGDVVEASLSKIYRSASREALSVEEARSSSPPPRDDEAKIGPGGQQTTSPPTRGPGRWAMLAKAVPHEEVEVSPTAAVAAFLAPPQKSFRDTARQKVRKALQEDGAAGDGEGGSMSPQDASTPPDASKESGGSTPEQPGTAGTTVKFEEPVPAAATGDRMAATSSRASVAFGADLSSIMLATPGVRVKDSGAGSRQRLQDANFQMLDYDVTYSVNKTEVNPTKNDSSCCVRLSKIIKTLGDIMTLRRFHSHSHKMQTAAVIRGGGSTTSYQDNALLNVLGEDVPFCLTQMERELDHPNAHRYFHRTLGCYLSLQVIVSRLKDIFFEVRKRAILWDLRYYISCGDGSC